MRVQSINNINNKPNFGALNTNLVLYPKSRKLVEAFGNLNSIGSWQMRTDECDLVNLVLKAISTLNN